MNIYHRFIRANPQEQQNYGEQFRIDYAEIRTNRGKGCLELRLTDTAGRKMSYGLVGDISQKFMAEMGVANPQELKGMSIIGLDETFHKERTVPGSYPKIQ